VSAQIARFGVTRPIFARLATAQTTAALRAAPWTMADGLFRAAPAAMSKDRDWRQIGGWAWPGASGVPV
jgi:hypothetical protein